MSKLGDLAAAISKTSPAIRAYAVAQAADSDALTTTAALLGSHVNGLLAADLIARVSALEAGVPAPPNPVPPPVSGPVFGVTPYTAEAWRTPIVASPKLHIDSAHMIGDSAIVGAFGELVGWAPSAASLYARWLGPREVVGRWWVSASQPLTPVVVSYPSAHTSMVPIPAGFVLPKSAETRTVIHCEDGTSWCGFGITQTNGKWSAEVFDRRAPSGAWLAKGDGADSSVGSGASRCPFDAGALSPWDFLNTPTGGHFDHALNINISSSASGKTVGHGLYVYPAFNGDGKTDGLLGIPIGSKAQLDPAYDVESRSDPEWLKQIHRTFQVMGSYCTDTATGQGDGDGIVTLLPACGPVGYSYPFDGLGPYANGVPLDVMAHFRVLA